MSREKTPSSILQPQLKRLRETRLKANKKQKYVVTALLKKAYSLVASIVIFGSPASSKNDRIWTGKHFVLGEGAQQYENLFKKQIVRIIPQIALPFTDTAYFWVFEIYHNDIRADASIELIFDLLEKFNVVYNDVTIRNYIVLAEELDRELPRTIIKIYKLKKGMKL